MKKKVAKSYKLTLPKTYKAFYQKPTKNIDIYIFLHNEIFIILKSQIFAVYKSKMGINIYDTLNFNCKSGK